MLHRARLPLVLSAALAAFAPSHAFAGELTAEQVAARRQLIEEAQGARAAGDDAKALDLATRAGDLQMSVSLRRFIAEEQLATGQSAAALGSAEVCVREAKSDGLAVDHAKACEDVIATARTRVGFLVIKTKAAVPGLHVKVGGHDVPPALLGQRYVVDPGEAVVEATADDAYPVRTKVNVTVGAETPVTLELVPKPKPIAPAKSGPFRVSPLVPIGATVALAGGAVALGVGISGKVALDDYEGRCTVPGAPASCASEQHALQSDLDRRAVAVDVALGVAGVGLVAGTVGLFLSGPSKQQKAALWRGAILF